MQTKTFSISEAFKFGWETFKKKPFFWIVAGLLIGIGSGGGNSGSDSNNGMGSDMFSQIDPSSIAIFMLILIPVILVLVYVFVALEIGAYKAFIGAANGDLNPKWKILISEFDFLRVFKFILLSILLAVIVVLGFIAFIIPGIYFALKYQYAPYFYVEKNTGIWESFKLSSAATNGVKWLLLGFALVQILLVIVGFIALFVGVFVALPISLLAGAYVYKKLSTSMVNVAPATPLEVPAV